MVDDVVEGELAVAVIGMAGRFSGTRDLDHLWQETLSGTELIRHFSEEELRKAGTGEDMLANPNFVPASGILEQGDFFEPEMFGLSKREAALMSPDHRNLLEAAWVALERAGYDPARFAGDIAVYVGVGGPFYTVSIQSAIDPAESYLSQLLGGQDFPATTLSYRLGLRGESVAVQSACSTSLLAIHLGVQCLLMGRASMVLVGGARVQPHPRGYVHAEGDIFSRDGHNRSFDAAANGTLPGSGVGVVVLKRYEDAVQDRDHIHAIVRASAANNDGRSKVSYMAPSLDGQTASVSEAIELAGVDPETIGFVEAHGTATAIGDPIEVQALTRAFRRGTAKEGYCALGALKSNIGHADAAAGVASFIKTVLAVEHGRIPPTVHFQKPHPLCELSHSPFFVNREAIDWPLPTKPRRALVGSLGIGGTNVHVLLEEAPVPSASPETNRPSQLLCLSARTPSALQRVAENLADYLEAQPQANLADVAYTWNLGRQRLGQRRSLVVKDHNDAAHQLRGKSGRQMPASAEAKGVNAAYLFPGPGDERIGMFRDVYAMESTFRAEMQRCLSAAKSRCGVDLGAALYPAQPTDDTSPSVQFHDFGMTLAAVLAIEVSLARQWMSWGVQPVALFGYSLGEVTAACIAGVFDLEDAIFLAYERGRLLQQFAGDSAMCYVELPRKEVETSIAKGVDFAVETSSTACVIAGTRSAIEKTEHALERKEVPFRRLNVKVAAHSRLIEQAALAFGQAVKKVKRGKPQIPIVSCLSGDWLDPDAAVDPEYWARQIRSTVMLDTALATIRNSRARALLEVGPGKYLASLAAAQETAQGPMVTISSAHGEDAEVKLSYRNLAQAVGCLWRAGVDIDFEAFYRPEERSRLVLPTYPFERQRYWIQGHGLQRPSLAEGHNTDATSFTVDAEGEEHATEGGDFAGAPPRNARERVIVEIWSKALAKPIGIEDDFFAAGASSLTAVGVASRLAQALGEKVTPAMFVELRTTERLAQALARAAGERPTNATAETQQNVASDPANESLVTIQSEGSKPPLFCLHAAGGGVMQYNDLSRVLGSDYPLYGVQARGFDVGSGESILDTVEDMVPNYIRAIETIDAQGPYYLVGNSFGGTLVYEMSRQLAAKGRRVAFAALIDTPAHASKFKEYVDRFLAMIQNYPQIAELKVLREDLLAVSQEDWLQYIHRRASGVGAWPPNVTVRDVEHILRVADANFVAMQKYEPQPYAGDILLVRAALDSEYLDFPGSADDDFGWKPYVHGKISVRWVEGANHFNLLADPYLSKVVENLKEFL